MNKFKNKILLIPIITSLLCISYLIYDSYFAKKDIHVNYTEFLKDMNNNEISQVTIKDNNTLSVILKNRQAYLTDNPGSLTLKENLLKTGVLVKESSSTPLNRTIPSTLLVFSIFSVILIGSKRFNLSTSITSMEVSDSKDNIKTKFNFNSVAGNEEAKESLKDIVDFLKNPEKYKSYGARMPKGVILYGDPGTGKTLLAKAVAGEAHVPFYAVSGSDFVQVYVGVGAARIRSLFKKAKAQGKAVIFIDEIDAIGKKREGGKSGGSDERDQTLNALLTEMSGFQDSDGIIVMAATNRLDVLDSALLRPGRFDRHVEVSLPDTAAREKIINLYLQNKPHENINLKALAHKTTYFSGAMLENLINEAAILAAKDSSGDIKEFHVEKAFSTVIAGSNKIVRDSIKEEDRKITAYHESGHALISLFKLPEDQVTKVTIIPTSKGAGGYTLSIPKDSAYQNMQYLKNKIMVLLGGRAAEEIIFGENMITTGAYSDLNQSTKIITTMVTEYGMGNSLGLLRRSALGSLGDVNSSEIIEECKSTLEELYNEVKECLAENINKLEAMACDLLEKETLYAEDINKIMEIN